MHYPRAPSSPTPTTTHHHRKEQAMHHSSSSSIAPSPARPGGIRDRQAGHLRDNDVPPRSLARDIVRGVTEELHGPHHQTHRPDVCAWIDCAAPARSRGVCPRHYDRTLRAGRRMLRRAVS